MMGNMRKIEFCLAALPILELNELLSVRHPIHEQIVYRIFLLVGI